MDDYWSLGLFLVLEEDPARDSCRCEGSDSDTESRLQCELDTAIMEVYAINCSLFIGLGKVVAALLQAHQRNLW